LIAFLRGLKGHFNESDHFGFEAAAWYWHFVDVIWTPSFKSALCQSAKLDEFDLCQSDLKLAVIFS
jgi:hypothetical protein